MTPQDKAILDKQSNKTLAEWYTTLNSWGWVSELPNPEPSSYIPSGRRGQIMDYIEAEIGSKECLRQHWVVNHLPVHDFEDWWNRNHVLTLSILPDIKPRRNLNENVCTCGANVVGSLAHAEYCNVVQFSVK